MADDGSQRIILPWTNGRELYMTLPLPGWLSRQRNGLYMLTQHRPVTECVGKTDDLDIYCRPGDGLGFRHICPFAAARIWGHELEVLESSRIVTMGGVIIQR